MQLGRTPSGRRLPTRLGSGRGPSIDRGRRMATHARRGRLLVVPLTLAFGVLALAGAAGATDGALPGGTRHHVPLQRGRAGPCEADDPAGSRAPLEVDGHRPAAHGPRRREPCPLHRADEETAPARGQAPGADRRAGSGRLRIPGPDATLPRGPALSLQPRSPADSPEYDAPFARAAHVSQVRRDGETAEDIH